MFSKAQIAKLSVEDQELLAEMELSKTRRREQLLERARGQDWQSRYWPLYFLSIFVVLSALYYFDVFHLQKDRMFFYLVGGITVLNVLIFNIARANRRLDALMELLDFDRKNPCGSNNSKDENIG